MPMFTVARQYLVPVYQTITVDAVDAAAACHAVMDDDAYPWDGAKTDWESARATTNESVGSGDTAYADTALPVPPELGGDD